MVFKDDRTGRERNTTHKNIIAGIDKCLSGWGVAEGGHSYAGWACTPEDEDAVEEWVRSRGDMKHVSWRSTDWRPQGALGHCHIYVVRPGHASLTD